MSKADIVFRLEGIARSMDNAEREGEGEDSPEGARMAKFSDTLLQSWSSTLKAIAEDLGK